MAVYIFLGDINGMTEMLAQMQKSGMLNGDYLLIYVDREEFSSSNPLKYFKGEALLVIYHAISHGSA